MENRDDAYNDYIKGIEDKRYDVATDRSGYSNGLPYPVAYNPDAKKWTYLTGICPNCGRREPITDTELAGAFVGCCGGYEADPSTFEWVSEWMITRFEHPQWYDLVGRIAFTKMPTGYTGNWMTVCTYAVRWVKYCLLVRGRTQANYDAAFDRHSNARLNSYEVLTMARMMKEVQTLATKQYQRLQEEQ